MSYSLNFRAFILQMYNYKLSKHKSQFKITLLEKMKADIKIKKILKTVKHIKTEVDVFSHPLLS